MHLANQGLSDEQLDSLLFNCRKLKDALTCKQVVIGSAVRSEFYRSPAVSLWIFWDGPIYNIFVA